MHQMLDNRINSGTYMHNPYRGDTRQSLDDQIMYNRPSMLKRMLGVLRHAIDRRYVIFINSFNVIFCGSSCRPIIIRSIGYDRF